MMYPLIQNQRVYAILRLTQMTGSCHLWREPILHRLQKGNQRVPALSGYA
jgi:hypothetical protein